MNFSSYIVTFPKAIRPNLETPIHVDILKSEGPVNVLAELLDGNNKTVVSGQQTIGSGENITNVCKVKQLQALAPPRKVHGHSLPDYRMLISDYFPEISP